MIEHTPVTALPGDPNVVAAVAAVAADDAGTQALDCGSVIGPTAMDPRPADRRWPDELRLLLGGDVDELLGDHANRRGGRIDSVQPRQVTHVPFGSSTAQFEVEVEWADRRRTTETYVTRCGWNPVDGARSFSGGSTTVSVWEWRSDPALPGLARALDVRQVNALFDDLGLGRSNVRLHVRAYRPGRRAVIEARDGDRCLFLKVVRPDRVEALHTVHRQLADAVPVPNSVGWTDDGVMVLPAVGGITLRDAIRGGHDVPDPATLSATLERLPAGVGRSSLRSHWLDEAHRHASVIAATVPAVRDVLRPTLERLAETGADVDDELVTVHGDFYEAQLMVDGSRVVGLLDVDTVGVGLRIDDMANFCAHLSVLGTAWRPADRVNHYGATVLAHAERRFDVRALRHRIAAATLGLATGPFRTLERNWEANTRARLALANRWLDSASDRRPG